MVTKVTSQPMSYDFFFKSSYKVASKGPFHAYNVRCSLTEFSGKKSWQSSSGGYADDESITFRTKYTPAADIFAAETVLLVKYRGHFGHYSQYFSCRSYLSPEGYTN
ncbi:hypothetical protein Y032_0221g2553 [Ancylostoma ceylanicum]|uniref:Uncharacterized protein n=1 Tax=Ancylostoma ceylanicum TaxID=53326 RepID=A0A016SJ20_9BILA|nr:hypothetical protein Y032_0221g2553 [Ancylostoma ceylanicum]